MYKSFIFLFIDLILYFDFFFNHNILINIFFLIKKQQLYVIFISTKIDYLNKKNVPH